MDKFVQRTTYRRAPKRGYEHTESSKVKSSCNDVEIVEIKESSLVEPKSDTAWRRCDSITESCHHKDANVEASPKKRKKLERSWSPIKPLQTLATIDEYPTLEAAAKNQRKTRSRSKNEVEGASDEIISLNSDVSLYDLSLDFGNKSWADLVMEEEEEEREKAEQAGGENNESSGKKRKERVRFKEDATLSRTVGDSLKFERSSSSRRSTRQAKSPDTDSSSVWHNRLRGSPPSKTPPTPKSPRRRRHEAAAAAADVSSRSTWRRRPLIDEDSQNTLTEVARITNASPDPARRLLESKPLLQGPLASAPAPSRLPEYYVAPKHGWELEPAVLERREKDIQKGYNSDVYKQYIKLIDKRHRVKGVHPKTPNKHLKMPRRSWDTQVRVWRRLLYAAVDTEIPSDASFISSSNCSETASEQDTNELKLDVDDDATTTLIMAKVVDESTLKASAMDVDAKGPTDFSTLSADIGCGGSRITRSQLRTH